MAIHLDGAVWLDNASFNETLPSNATGWTRVQWINIDDVTVHHQTFISSGEYNYNSSYDEENYSKFYGHGTGSGTLSYSSDNTTALSPSTWYLIATRQRVGIVGVDLCVLAKGAASNNYVTTGTTDSTDTLNWQGLSIGSDATGTENSFNPGQNPLTGASSQTALWLSTALTDAQLVSLAGGTQMDGLATAPDHFWKLSTTSDLTDYGSAATLYNLTVTGTGTPTTVADPYTWGGGTTINATTGAMTLQGQLAQVLAGQTISGTAGSLTLQGQVAQVLAGQTISATSGLMTLQGQQATVVTSAGTNINASAGLLSLQGQQGSVVVHPTTNIDATTGKLTLQGQPAQVLAGQTIQGTTGKLTLQGQQAQVVAGKIAIDGNRLMIVTEDDRLMQITGNARILRLGAEPDRLFIIADEIRIMEVH